MAGVVDADTHVLEHEAMWENFDDGGEMYPCEDGEHIAYDDYIAEKKSMVEAAEGNLKAIQAIADLIDGSHHVSYVTTQIKDVLIDLQPLLAASLIADHFKGEK